MKTNWNRPVSELNENHLKNIKVICFDGDGVTKRKGTWFVKKKGKIYVGSYAPTRRLIKKLVRLSTFFHITFSSGRSMAYLKRMYGEVVRNNGSLQAEIGTFLWFENKLYENFELTEKRRKKIKNLRRELKKIKNHNIKGFEPKEAIITLHATGKVDGVEEMVKKLDPEEELYCWWNGEAYDIGFKWINKGTGLKKLTEKMGLEMNQVMTVGNGINDENMKDTVGIDVSTDKRHLKADFIASGEHLGGEVLVNRLLELV